MRIPITASVAERQMAVPLVLILLFVPAMAIITVRIMGSAGVWPLWIPMILLLALLLVLAAGVYRRNRGALTAAAWAYAFAYTGLIQLVYAAFILVTGRVPNKYHSAPIPRSSAVTNLFLAASWWAIALGLSRWNARHRRS
jgi:hypothetical protein